MFPAGRRRNGNYVMIMAVMQIRADVDKSGDRVETRRLPAQEFSPHCGGQKIQQMMR
jgi:hypothetical protein